MRLLHRIRLAVLVDRSTNCFSGFRLVFRIVAKSRKVVANNVFRDREWPQCLKNTRENLTVVSRPLCFKLAKEMPRLVKGCLNSS